MLDNDTRPGPPGATTLLACPVNDCPWRYERTRPPVTLASMTETILHGFPKTAMGDAIQQDELAISVHLAEHPVVDFVRTIAELRSQLAATDR